MSTDRRNSATRSSGREKPPHLPSCLLLSSAVPERGGVETPAVRIFERLFTRAATATAHAACHAHVMLHIELIAPTGCATSAHPRSGQCPPARCPPKPQSPQESGKAGGLLQGSKHDGRAGLRGEASARPASCQLQEGQSGAQEDAITARGGVSTPRPLLLPLAQTSASSFDLERISRLL